MIRTALLVVTETVVLALVLFLAWTKGLVGTAAIFWQQVRFDWTISFGTVLQLFTMFLMVVGLYIKLNERIQALESKMELVFGWWKEEIGHVCHNSERHKR